MVTNHTSAGGRCGRGFRPNHPFARLDRDPKTGDLWNRVDHNSEDRPHHELRSVFQDLASVEFVTCGPNDVLERGVPTIELSQLVDLILQVGSVAVEPRPLGGGRSKSPVNRNRSIGYFSSRALFLMESWNVRVAAPPGFFRKDRHRVCGEKRTN